jgi:hypothetical protein
MRKRSRKDCIVIKPIGWRQACFTLFLLVVAGFFAVVTKFGVVFSWVGTLFMALMTLLSVLDQIFEWSRLKIDRNGYSLRGWFRRQHFSHHEIEDFRIDEFAGKKLLTLELKDHARKSRNLPDEPIPFPCCFGRPVDQVLQIVRSTIDRTPRPRSSD